MGSHGIKDRVAIVGMGCTALAGRVGRRYTPVPAMRPRSRARHALGWLALTALMLIGVLIVLPSLEFACDGSQGDGHDSHHAHASPAVLDSVAYRPFVAQRGVAGAPVPPARPSALASLVFVPPRA